MWLYLQIQRETDNLCKLFVGINLGVGGLCKVHETSQKTDKAAYTWQLKWSGCSQHGHLQDSVASTLTVKHGAWEQSKLFVLLLESRLENNNFRDRLLVRPCTSELLLLTTDRVARHDVIALSAAPYRCRPVLPVTLLLIYSFCSQNSQRLEVYALFMNRTDVSPALTSVANRIHLHPPPPKRDRFSPLLWLHFESSTCPSNISCSWAS